MSEGRFNSFHCLPNFIRRITTVGRKNAPFRITRWCCTKDLAPGGRSPRRLPFVHGFIVMYAGVCGVGSGFVAVKFSLDEVEKSKVRQEFQAKSNYTTKSFVHDQVLELNEIINAYFSEQSYSPIIPYYIRFEGA